MPHKNDMTQWEMIGCQRDCLQHATKRVNINLGTPHGYNDLTQIPGRFRQSFDIEIWDTTITPVDGGPYCPARDAVSETIISHGIWEPQETAIMLMCFEQLAGGLFIDFGSQIGWFSTLATLNGMNVLSFDADPDCVQMTYANLAAHVPLLASIGAYNERLDADVAPFSINDDRMDLRTVAKIDVEGAERFALDKLQPLIDEHWVKYILIEISPVFNDTYEDVINRLVDADLVPYQLPPKRTPPVEINQLADLEGYELPRGRYDVRRYIAGLHQADLLFVLGGL